MTWAEIFIAISFYNSTCWLPAPDWLDQSGDRRAMAEVHHGGGAILRYSPIHIKIIEYRCLSSNHKIMLPNLCFRRIKELGLLRVRKRGNRGGRSRFSRGRFNYNINYSTD